jgi:hypothetical protein
MTPGPALTDMRVSRLQAAILGHVGRYKGWVALDQGHLARWFGVKRPSVNAAVAALVDLGYVERLTQAQTGDTFCLYKIVIDASDGTDTTREACQPEPDTPSTGGVSAPDEHPCQPEPDTGVSHGLTPSGGVVHSSRADLDLTRSTRSPPPPPSRRKRRDRGARERDDSQIGREVDQLLGGLSTTPGGSEVVTHLLDPILRRRRILAPDPAAVVANLASWATQFPVAALKAAAHRVLEERHSAVTEEHIVGALRAVHANVGRAAPIDRPAAPAVAADGFVTITERDHPSEFAGWLAYYEAQSRMGRSARDGRGAHYLVTLGRKYGALRVPSLTPPPPPASLPTAAAAAPAGTTVH